MRIEPGVGVFSIGCHESSQESHMRRIGPAIAEPDDCTLALVEAVSYLKACKRTIYRLVWSERNAAFWLDQKRGW